MKPSPDELENGWTPESLAAYLRDRADARSAYGPPEPVAGNVVTEWAPPRPPIRIYSALNDDEATR